MALRNLNNTSLCSSNRLMVGFIFQPSISDIFSYFLPKRLIVGQPVLPRPYDTIVKDIDLYGEMSPQQLFEHQSSTSCDETEFYFFTTLKKHNESNKRNKRVAGGGTWDGDRYEECKMVVKGEMVKVGIKKSFKFRNFNKNQCLGVSWILHEYKMDKDYYVKTYNNNNINPNVVDNIVFCHVHKKVEKKIAIEMDKKRKESFNCEEPRKRICNENKNLESTKILEKNPTTQNMDNNNNNNINEGTCSVESSTIIKNNECLNNGYDDSNNNINEGTCSVESSIIIKNNECLNNGYDNNNNSSSNNNNNNNNNDNNNNNNDNNNINEGTCSVESSIIIKNDECLNNGYDNNNSSSNNNNNNNNNNNINEGRCSVESSKNSECVNNGYDNKGGNDEDLETILMSIKYDDDPLDFDWESNLQAPLDKQTTNEDDGVSFEELIKNNCRGSQDDTHQLFPNSTTNIPDDWWSTFLRS